MREVRCGWVAVFHGTSKKCDFILFFIYWDVFHAIILLATVGNIFTGVYKVQIMLSKSQVSAVCRN